MTLWQMDLIDGPPLADGTRTNCTVGIDRASRMCICAQWTVRGSREGAGTALRSAVAAYGAPDQLMTDYALRFVDRGSATEHQTPFDIACIEYGIDHLLAPGRRPTDMRDVERFEKRFVDEFLSNTTAFADLSTAQQATDSWVATYNDDRNADR